MKIIGSTKVTDVINSPHAQGFGKYLFPLEERMPGDGMTLDNINPLLPFHNHINTQSTVDSIEYLLDTASKGNQVFYRFYSEREISEDPRKEDTGLFFFKGKDNAPFAIISAGGAFNYVGSVHEGFPYALKLIEAGYNAFVLQYRVGGEKIATEDLAAATSYIIKNCEKFRVAEKYSLWGSSAGARMAANIGSHGTKKYGGTDVIKPSAVVMLYTAHTDLSEDEVPTFVAIGENDDIVNPPAVMKERVDKLAKMGVPTEYHMYKNLKHGFGLGIGTSAEGWIDDAIRFLENS